MSYLFLSLSFRLVAVPFETPFQEAHVVLQNARHEVKLGSLDTLVHEFEPGVPSDHIWDVRLYLGQVDLSCSKLLVSQTHGLFLCLQEMQLFLGEGQIGRCYVDRVEILGQGQNHSVLDEVLSDSLPLFDWSLPNALLLSEGLSEEASDEVQWRDVTEIVVQYALQALLDLDLGVQQVCIAIQELVFDQVVIFVFHHGLIKVIGSLESRQALVRRGLRGAASLFCSDAPGCSCLVLVNGFHT